MEQIEAAMNQKTNDTDEKKMEAFTVNRGPRDHIAQWFVETQTIIQSDGKFPSWFRGFISRQEAEDQLKHRAVGCFLIRLSEKAIGYILSYKGEDRCRHFVINQTHTGLFVISGDFTTHNSLTELIDHFKTTPIQPFGEYLTSYNPEMDRTAEEPADDLYDVIQNMPMGNSVSVKALKSLWEQAGVSSQHIPAVLSKNMCKITTSISMDRSSQETRIPHLPKKNAQLRNSLSSGFLCMLPLDEQKGPSESKPSVSSGDGEIDGLDKEGTKELKLVAQLENHQSLCSHNLMSSTPQETLSASTYKVLELKNLQTPKETIMQPNPLYQSSSAPCHGKQIQPEYDNSTNLSRNVLLSESLYQNIAEQRDSNTYEPLSESNTYESIPTTESHMYASLNKTQTPSTDLSGRKNPKWWKFRLENKK